MKVRIFWKSPVWQKRKSPDFLDKSCFKKRQKSGFFGKNAIFQKLKTTNFAQKATEIFKNISSDLIKSSWKMTEFKKFAHFGQSSDPDVSSQDNENELKKLKKN